MSLAGKIDVTDAQLRLVCDLLGRHLPGTEAWVYGSRVKGTARRNSDLDLVVFVDRASKARLSDLRESFEESDLPFPVDVHVWEEMPQEFQEQIAALNVSLNY